MSKTATISANYIRLMGFLGLFLSFAFNACKKITTEEEQYSYVRFINMSPTLATYNVYLDDAKINTSGALPFGGSIPFKLYSGGQHSVKITTATNITPLLTKDISLLKKKSYSCYLIDKGDKMDWLMIEDTDDATSKTQAKFKFINLSPDAPALSLVIKDGSSLVEGKAYKGSSEYALIDAKTYTFEVKDTATGQVKAVIPDVELKGGNYYTIVARGMLNPAGNDQAFSAQNIASQNQ